MPVCCGKHRGGNFCPVCGEALRTDGLNGLLLHCQSTAKQYRTELAVLENPDSWRYREWSATMKAKRITTVNRLMSKWQQWADSLQKLMQDTEGATPC